MTQAQRDISWKLKILKHGEKTEKRYFGISREIFYRWKRTYAQEGESGLINSKPSTQRALYLF